MKFFSTLFAAIITATILSSTALPNETITRDRAAVLKQEVEGLKQKLATLKEKKPSIFVKFGLAALSASVVGTALELYEDEPLLSGDHARITLLWLILVSTSGLLNFFPPNTPNYASMIASAEQSFLNVINSNRLTTEHYQIEANTFLAKLAEVKPNSVVIECIKELIVTLIPAGALTYALTNGDTLTDIKTLALFSTPRLLYALLNAWLNRGLSYNEMQSAVQEIKAVLEKLKTVTETTTLSSTLQ